jgi:hypothetical protein
MVHWQFCPCGRIVDEYETRCHWCGRPPAHSFDDAENPSRGDADQKVSLEEKAERH